MAVLSHFGVFLATTFLLMDVTYFVYKIISTN